ncbi:hypothetical protein CKA32_005944 [Geitlerinema sp. FC II]|nr:hypothetical protein CKA32_005944 [Geitlerinema sp. FC II]
MTRSRRWITSSMLTTPARVAAIAPFWIFYKRAGRRTV